MRSRLGYLVLVLVLGMVLQACGTPAANTGSSTPIVGSGSSGGGGGGGGGKPDPCKLLTADDLKSELGATFKEGELEAGTDLSGPGAAACHWTPDPADAYDVVTLSVEPMLASMFNFGKSQDGSTAIEGVGEDAYIDSAGELHIKKGSLEVTLVIGTGSNRKTTNDQMSNLGKLAASNI